MNFAEDPMATRNVEFRHIGGCKRDRVRQCTDEAIEKYGEISNPEGCTCDTFIAFHICRCTIHNTSWKPNEVQNQL